MDTNYSKIGEWIKILLKFFPQKIKRMEAKSSPPKKKKRRIGWKEKGLDVKKQEWMMWVDEKKGTCTHSLPCIKRFWLLKFCLLGLMKEIDCLTALKCCISLSLSLSLCLCLSLCSPQSCTSMSSPFFFSLLFWLLQQLVSQVVFVGFFFFSTN